MRWISGWILGIIGILLLSGSAMASVYWQREAQWEAVVLAEASGEPYEGKLAVAEVLRNRDWNPQGFVGIRRPDLARFLSQQPPSARAQARQALKAARAGSDLTGGATHFENVEAFGVPAWARRMTMTAKVGRHTFFKEGRS